MIVGRFHRPILIIDLTFFKQKWQTFTGSRFSTVKIWCFFLVIHDSKYNIFWFKDGWPDKGSYVIASPWEIWLWEIIKGIFHYFLTVCKQNDESTDYSIVKTIVSCSPVREAPIQYRRSVSVPKLTHYKILSFAISYIQSQWAASVFSSTTISYLMLSYVYRF